MKTLSQLINKIKHLIKNFAGALRSGVWILEGDESSTNKPLSIMFVGSQVQKYYIADIIFSKTPEQTEYGKKYIWNILYLIKTNKRKCSLIIIEGSLLHKRLYANKQDFYAPIWLKSTTNIPLEITNKSLKNDICRIKRHELEFKITREPNEIHEFYHDMYLPTLNTRHQEKAIQIAFESMLDKIQQEGCDLLLITKSGINIAGVLIVTSGDTPRMWANGVKDANPVYWGYGAIAATFYFSSIHLSKQGYKQMDLGMTRSFLNDGILQYKKKLNNRVIGHDTNGFILKPLIYSTSLVNFFIANPFVFLQNNQLISAVFINKEQGHTNQSFATLEKKYFLQGLSGLNILEIDSKTGLKKIFCSNLKP